MIAVLVAVVVALAMWLGSSALDDSGSYEWCADRGLTPAECNVVNDLADQMGQSPADVVDFLNNSLGPID